MKKQLLVLLAAGTVGSALAQSVARIPLFEVFTSSTCGPCAGGNVTYEGIVSTKPVAEYVSVKYQQNFPGTGDPYATTVGVNRRTTPYAINSIPRMEIDGGWDGNAASFTNTLYNNAKAVAPLYDINGTYTYDAATQTINAKVRFKSLGTVTSPKLFFAVIESVTTKNKKSNGETKFENVVKRMLPNELGTVITVATTWDSLSFTCKFNGSYRLPADGAVANRINDATEHSVENFANIRPVVWIQGSDKKVYQAFNLVKAAVATDISKADLSINEVSLYPNPTNSNTTIEFNLNKAETVTVNVLSVLGQVVYTKTLTNLSAGTQTIDLNSENWANGIYNVTIATSNGNVSRKLEVNK